MLQGIVSLVKEFVLGFHTGLGAGGQTVPAVYDLAPPHGDGMEESLVPDAAHQTGVVFRPHFREDYGQIADGIFLSVVHERSTSIYRFLIL